jgi:hypothetical protein
MDERDWRRGAPKLLGRDRAAPWLDVGLVGAAGIAAPTRVVGRVVGRMLGVNDRAPARAGPLLLIRDDT